MTLQQSAMELMPFDYGTLGIYLYLSFAVFLLVKLKYEIDGSHTTYETDNGVKQLHIKFKKGIKSPAITTFLY